MRPAAQRSSPRRTVNVKPVSAEKLLRQNPVAPSSHPREIIRNPIEIEYARSWWRSKKRAHLKRINIKYNGPQTVDHEGHHTIRRVEGISEEVDDG